MKWSSVSLIAIALVCLILISGVEAEGQRVLTVQGRLTDASSSPLDGFFDITYRMFTAPTGGTELWSETHTNVPVEAGLFKVDLGETTPLIDQFFDIEIWIEFQVEADPPLSPRQKLGSAPHAFQAGVVTATRPIGGSLDTAQVKLEATDTGASMRLRVVPTSQTTGRIALDVTQQGSQIAVGDVNGDGRLDVLAGSTGSPDGGEGASLSISNAAGTKGVVTGVSTGRSSLSITGDPDFDLLRLSATADSGKIAISAHPGGGDPDFDLLRISGSGGGGGGAAGTEMVMTGDPDFDLLRVSAKQDTGKITIRAQGGGGDPDFDLLRIVAGKGIGDGDAAVSITGDPDFDLLRLSANADTAKITISGQVVGDPDFDLFKMIGAPKIGEATMKVKNSIGNVRGTTTEVDSATARQFLWTQTGGPITKMIEHSADSQSSYASISNAAGSKGLVTTCAPGHVTVSATRDGHTRVTIASDDTSSSIAIGEEGVQIAMVADTGSSNPSATLSISNAAGSKGLATGVSPGMTTLRMLRDGAEPVLISCIDNGSSSIAIEEEGVQISLQADSGGAGYIAIDQPGVKIASTVGADSTGEIAISQEGVKIVEMGADENGVGNIAISQEGVKVIEMNADAATASFSLSQPGLGPTVTLSSDGTGFFADKIGVGTTGSNHIEVIGGANCDGTTWNNASDVNSKENFQPINGEEILERLEDLEITRWNYIGKDDAEHIGPTAQDFYKAFGVGSDDKSISTVDPSGIALAAIKELYKKSKDVDELKKQLDELAKQVAKLAKEKK